MPKAYIILLEVEGKTVGVWHKVPMFNHGFATRKQAEKQIEESTKDFERWRMSIQAFPIVPASEG
jgi:hypothetical protein